MWDLAAFVFVPILAGVPIAKRCKKMHMHIFVTLLLL